MIVPLKAGREDKHPVLRKAERVIVKIICLHVFLIHNAPEELVKALNAAKESVDNAITGICNAIVKAHQTPMKVEMTDESKQTMKEGQTKMLNREAELFKNHEEAIGKSIQTLESKFKKVVDDFKGVWIDKKTFNIDYWTFFGMLEITLMSVALLIYYWVKFGAPWNC